MLAIATSAAILLTLGTSQDPATVIRDAGTCPMCRISSRRVVRLGASGDGAGGLISRPYAISQDSKGRYFVVMPESGDPPHMYSKSGVFIAQVGRTGEGPGEYRRPRLVRVTTGDSVEVYDEGNARYTLLTPELRVSRSFAIPRATNDGIRLTSGLQVLNAKVSDADRIGLPLHVFEAGGRYVRSFGTARPIALPGDVTRHARWLFPLTNGHVLVAHMGHRYRVEEWVASGELIAAWDRDVDWYRPYDRYWFPTPTMPPAPRTTGLWRDAGGLIWVVLQVPDRTWARGLELAREAEGGQALYRWENWQLLFDTIVEVFDPRSGNLIASQRFDHTTDWVVTGGRVASFEEDANGYFTAVVYDLTLIR